MIHPQKIVLRIRRPIVKWQGGHARDLRELTYNDVHLELPVRCPRHDRTQLGITEIEAVGFGSKVDMDNRLIRHERSKLYRSFGSLVVNVVESISLVSGKVSLLVGHGRTLLLRSLIGKNMVD
jgi:hypothetical protein